MQPEGKQPENIQPGDVRSENIQHGGAERPPDPDLPAPLSDRRQVLRSLRTMIVLSLAVLKGGELAAGRSGADDLGPDPIGPKGPFRADSHCGQPDPATPGGYFEDKDCNADGQDLDCGKSNGHGLIYKDDDCVGYSPNDPNKDLDCGRPSPWPQNPIYQDHDCVQPQPPNPMPEGSDKACGMGEDDPYQDHDCGYENGGIANMDSDCGLIPRDALPPFPLTYSDSDCGKVKNAAGGRHTDSDCGRVQMWGNPEVYEDQDCTQTLSDQDCAKPDAQGGKYKDDDCPQTGQDSLAG